MERRRMVGDYELVYEPDMKMFRMMNKNTEEFSKWFTSEEAEEIKQLNDDEFFAKAEKAILNARNSGNEQTGDTKKEL